MKTGIATAFILSTLLGVAQAAEPPAQPLPAVASVLPAAAWAPAAAGSATTAEDAAAAPVLSKRERLQQLRAERARLVARFGPALYVGP